MKIPDEGHHPVELKEVAPRPAQRKPTLILIALVAAAWVLQGLGLLSYMLHSNHDRDARASQRDVEHTQTEQQLASANKKIADLQVQLQEAQHKVEATAITTRDSLCTVAFALQPRDPSDSSYPTVIEFEKHLGCKPAPSTPAG